MSLLEVSGLKKVYKTRFGGNAVEALRNVNFSVNEGEYVAIMGESGSGKTTLLNILAALDKPTAGTVLLDGRDFTKIRESEAATFRRDHLGFVFQEFNLLDTFTLEDNIYLPLVLAGKSYDEMRTRLIDIAETLGIRELLKKYPYEVSGGEKQRISIARAFLKDAPIILLDEATASLDVENETLIQTALSRLIADKTVLVIAHRMRTVAGADKIVVLSDGIVAEEGAPEILMKQNGIYARMVKLQAESQKWKLA